MHTHNETISKGFLAGFQAHLVAGSTDCMADVSIDLAGGLA